MENNFSFKALSRSITKNVFGVMGAFKVCPDPPDPLPGTATEILIPRAEQVKVKVGERVRGVGGTMMNGRFVVNVIVVVVFVVVFRLCSSLDNVSTHQQRICLKQ